MRQLNKLLFLCKKLKHVILPEGVKEIGAEAFAECTNLEKVEIPKSVVKVGKKAFAGTKAK